MSKVISSEPLQPQAVCGSVTCPVTALCSAVLLFAGVIRTAVADLDRETQDRYEVVIRATDMAGQLGGLSGSTTVTIVVTDVNDNPPRFPQSECCWPGGTGACHGSSGCWGGT